MVPNTDASGKCVCIPQSSCGLFTLPGKVKWRTRVVIPSVSTPVPNYITASWIIGELPGRIYMHTYPLSRRIFSK